MLSQMLINQIDQLRDTFSAKGAKENSEKAPILVSAESDTVRISAQVIDGDRLGYLLTSFGAQQLHDGREEAVIDKAQVDDQVNTLVGRITYLTETLALVEKSPDFSLMLIRSATPDKRADGIYYHELTLADGTSIHLVRRCYNFQTRRRGVVPFTLSKNVFEQLVQDVEEILDDTEETIDLPSRFTSYPSIWETQYAV